MTQGVDFGLAKYGGITGTVTDVASGQPVSQLWVEVYSSTRSLVGSGRTDSTGGYAFTQLPAGAYFVKTDDSPYLDQLFDGIPCEESCELTTGTPVVVDGGLTTANIDFALQLAGSVSGKVTASATGAPITSGYVMLYDGSGAPAGEAYLSTSGSYYVTGLDAGTYFAVAKSTTHLDELYNNVACQPSCNPTTGTPIAVTLGLTTTGIDFALDLGGGVLGNVTAAATGAPLPFIEVQLFGSTGTSAGYVNTNSQGAYIFQDLQPGIYFARSRRDSSSTYLGQLCSNLPCEPSCTVTSGTPLQVVKGVAISVWCARDFRSWRIRPRSTRSESEQRREST